MPDHGTEIEEFPQAKETTDVKVQGQNNFSTSGVSSTSKLCPKGPLVIRHSMWRCWREFDAVRRKRGELWRDRSFDSLPRHAPENCSLRVSQFLTGKGISATDRPSYSPNLPPADFWLFPNVKSLPKGKRFWALRTSNYLWTKFWQTFFVILRMVLNNGRSAENIIKNMKEIILKNSGLLVSAACKIIKKKLVPKLICPTIHSHIQPQKKIQYKI
jgi:hypothetical protein